MGGDGHGHHHAPYVVPKPEVYANQVDKIRELNRLQNELAKRGLKDPWIRNEVWRYNQKVWGNPRLRIFTFLFKGLPLGAAVAGATIAYEEYFDVYGQRSGHGHGDHGHGAHDGHH